MSAEERTKAYRKLSGKGFLFCCPDGDHADRHVNCNAVRMNTAVLK